MTRSGHRALDERNRVSPRTIRLLGIGLVLILGLSACDLTTGADGLETPDEAVSASEDAELADGPLDRQRRERVSPGDAESESGVGADAPVGDLPAMEGSSRPYGQQATAVDRRLGLHVTSDELTIWRARAHQGDSVDGRSTNYVRHGDVIENSPGDWERIASLKNSFVSDPYRYVWLGPSHNWPHPIINNSSWPRNPSGMPPTRNSPQSAEPIRDAAFFAMVLGSDAVPNRSLDTPTRDRILVNVKQVILEMVRSRYNDYSNTQRYSRTRFGDAYHPSYQIAAWLNKLVYAYDYAQVADPDVWTAAEKEEFIWWLDGAAEWWAAIVDKRRDGMFNADGTTTEWADEPYKQVIWSGGPRAEKVHARVDNHVPRLAAVPTFAGLLAQLEEERSGLTTLSDARIDEGIGYARKSVSDYLVAEFIPAQPGTGGGVRSGGGNMFRWPGNTGPTEGWKYAMEHLGHNVMLADHVARAGDTSLYEMSTTAGTSTSRGTLPDDGLYGAGGPKTLRAAMERMWSYIDESSGPRRYGCDDCATAARRYDSTDGIKGHERANEWESIQGNVYFRSDYLRSIYMRSRAGTPDLPESPKDAQGYIENGDSSTYPGANFMFALTEDRVWPYDAPVR